jgi:hypothetical protein
VFLHVTKATFATDSKPEEKNTFRQLAATNPCAHRTAMTKLRLYQAVNRKIKNQLLSETNHQITK